MKTDLESGAVGVRLALPARLEVTADRPEQLDAVDPGTAVTWHFLGEPGTYTCSYS